MNYIIESSIVGSILVGLILLIRAILKTNMKKSIIYYLWFILIIKLLIPFGPESNLSIFNLINVSSNEESNLLNNNYKIVNEEISKSISNIINSPVENKKDVNIDENITINEEVGNREIEESMNFSYKSIFIIWLIGGTIIISKILFSYLQLKLKINKEYNKYRNYHFDIDIKEELKLLSIRRNIEVRITNEISSPSLFGAINPKILIPLKILKNVNKNELRYIIIHELCHYKRKDILVLWLASIVRVIHWFNPIIRYGLNIMSRDCEAACDEMTLSKINKDENINYGNTILNVIQLIHNNNNVPGTTSMITNKKGLKERIKSIAENKKFNSKTIFMGTIAIVIFSVIVLINKISSEKLNLIDSSKINEVTIRVMPSPPRGKNILKSEDINKIIDYINSIKVKDKQKEVYNGWEVNIKLSGDENYNISFLENYISINGVQYAISNREIQYIRALYENMNYEERDLVSNEAVENEVLNFYTFLNKLVDKNIEVRHNNEGKLATKDNGYSAELYTIDIKGEEIKIYEYINEEAALNEITLFNGDDYHEISYATDYILIDMDELFNTENVYLKNKLICLYNGKDDEIKEALSSILEKPLSKLSKDKLIISEQDITLIYPSQWIGMQEPIEIVIDEESYKIDTYKVNQNKNICEVKIENDDLREKIRKFDGDELYIKWKDNIIGDNNKTVLTKIMRNDFIRVVKIKDGYIDANSVYPEIEIATKDKTLIGEKLFEEYLNINNKDWFANLLNGINKEGEETILEYKVYNVALNSDGNNIFTVTLSYDIKPTDKNSIWYAGNGVIEDDWIIGKFCFIDIEKTSENKYRIISIYTG